MKKMSFLRKTNLFVRSLIFSIIMNTSVFFYSFFCIITFIFPVSYRCKFIAGFTDYLLWVLKIVCQINYKIEGLENIPKDRNGIILSKHQSTWETFFLPTIFPQTNIILKKELLWVPFFGWGLATIEPIAINRNQKSSAMEQILKQGKESLDKGRWVLVFPEGTRIAPGAIGNYRPGGARLATHTGYPVIPVAHDAGRYWPRRGFIKIPGTVHIVIGPLIETKHRKADEVLMEAKNWIEMTIQRIDKNVVA
jgi:1-acyl-sn-glycerol-3-phosphate acyltransferase